MMSKNRTGYAAAVYKKPFSPYPGKERRGRKTVYTNMMIGGDWIDSRKNGGRKEIRQTCCLE